MQASLWRYKLVTSCSIPRSNRFTGFNLLSADRGDHKNDTGAATVYGDLAGAPSKAHFSGYY